VAFTLVKPSRVQDNQHLCLVFCFMWTSSTCSWIL